MLLVPWGMDYVYLKYQEKEQIFEILCLAPPKPNSAKREQPYLAASGKFSFCDNTTVCFSANELSFLNL